MNKAVFLDRDGTIIKERKYLSKPEGVELFEDAAESLRELRRSSYLLFIVTNQSGIGRGYFSEEDYNKVQEHLIRLLEQEGISIEKSLHCPHKPEDNCDCRKPKTGSISKVIDDYNIDCASSWVLGDKLSDVGLAKNIGASSILLLTGHGNEESLKAEEGVVQARSLSEAVRLIKGESGERL